MNLLSSFVRTHRKRLFSFILFMLCCEQLFNTSVHIWKEMRSCRIVTLLSPRIFHFVLVWFLNVREIACTRCTCLELWKSMLQFVLYAEPCLSPLGCRVCYCFCFNCPEGPQGMDSKGRRAAGLYH